MTDAQPTVWDKPPCATTICHENELEKSEKMASETPKVGMNISRKNYLLFAHDTLLWRIQSSEGIGGSLQEWEPIG